MGKIRALKNSTIDAINDRCAMDGRIRLIERYNHETIIATVPEYAQSGGLSMRTAYPQ